MMTPDTTHNPAYQALAEKFAVKADVLLKPYTAFRIGGPADLLAEPSSKAELDALLLAAKELEIPVTLIGGGTNLLIRDNGIRGLVICTAGLCDGFEIIDGTAAHPGICVMAGHHLASLCRFAAKHALSGLEFAAGIPGSVGGGIAMNAGTPSGVMGDVVDRLEIWDFDTCSFKTLERKDLAFSYRKLDVRGVITRACIRLRNGDSEIIQAKMDAFIKLKRNTQPVSQASAGCFFKNPAPDRPAGLLIEQAGLKGMKIKDAMVSDVHANYIVNTGRATSSDVLELADHIRRVVREKFNVDLETEVRIEGE